MPEFHPTFKTGSNTQQADKFLVESFPKEGSTSQFHPSLRDFLDNSNVREDFGQTPSRSKCFHVQRLHVVDIFQVFIFTKYFIYYSKMVYNLPKVFNLTRLVLKTHSIHL
jgi:hypothetical protein